MDRRWQRRGLLIPAPPPQSWAQSHAALPTPDMAGPGQMDVYFSPRDRDGHAHIALARVEASRPNGELRLASHGHEPVLSPGPLGAFDDSGVTVSCLVHSEGDTSLYYTGWTRGVSVPFYFYVGLAVRRAGSPAFERVSSAPILERTAIDPYLTASPWVIRDLGIWRMWYVSGLGWERVNGEPRHRYHIRYAESEDGVTWRREGRVSIDFADDAEYAFGRPCVVRDDDCYRMWFSARGERYRLGYAESQDGLTWHREDRSAGLEPASSGWDSEMLAYPAIVDENDARYLLYNGNGYGQTGIGYATAQREN